VYSDAHLYSGGGNSQDMSGREVLITGGAGFIGSHLVDRLLARGDRVTIIDNFNDFYDPAVKADNIAHHSQNSNFKLHRGDIRNTQGVQRIFDESQIDVVVHLAAMAGVRPSLKDPALYMDVNVLGTQRLVDAAVHAKKKPLFIFGSSSSVYGARPDERFYETDKTDRPISPYAASKVAGEGLMYAAHHTSGLPVICLRFFTVFGPRQRPDLAIHKFGDLIYNDKPIEIYGDGKSKRDYTFVDDVVSGIERAAELKETEFEIVNLGRSEPVELSHVIECLEKSLGKKAKIEYRPPQLGDVPNTFAGIDKAKQLLGYAPSTSIEQGIDEFVRWYLARKGRFASAV
jgi:UDP-glucuronate 4-epimerase